MTLKQTHSILDEIVIERSHQDFKWGEQNYIPILWLAILGEEFGEVSKAALEANVDDYRTELIQLAAVAVAMVESLDRNQNLKVEWTS